MLAALLPRFFQLGRRDVAARPTFPGHNTQVPAEIFHCGTAKEPASLLDLINDGTAREDDHVLIRGITGRIGIFGDTEIFLDDTPLFGEERPVGAGNATSVLTVLANAISSSLGRTKASHFHNSI